SRLLRALGFEFPPSLIVVDTASRSVVTTEGRRLLADDCPPCRQWVKQLAPVYEQMKANGISLEIVFCSSDRTQEAYDQFTAQMPWPAFAYDPSKTLALTRVYNISEGSTDDIQFSLSVMDGLSKRLFEERMKIEERRVEEAEKKSDESAEQGNGNGLSKSASSEECSSTGSDLPIPPQADPLQLLYTGEDPICDH
ncbi:hypothetical protein TELCIR_19890, partial [Teladorsagia circumcincta]